MGGLQKYDKMIKDDREAFRAEATSALDNFGPNDRELAAALETEHVLTSDVLKAWYEQIEPIYSDLDAERDDIRFRNIIVRRIGFDETQAEFAIENMIASRKAQLLDEVLTNLYSIDIHEELYQRAYAEELLAKDSSEIDDFAQRYGNFIEVMAAAETSDVILLDPHAGWLERQRTALAINKERQRLIEDEDIRLTEIDTILAALSESNNHIVGKIVERNWSFVTILDLRNKYQKQLDARSKADKDDPATKLKIFEKVTQNFRDTQGRHKMRSDGGTSLRAIKKTSDEIYNLLLEIFDLPAAERNQLLSDIQTYSKLSKERDLILHIQRNREHFLAHH